MGALKNISWFRHPAKPDSHKATENAKVLALCGLEISENIVHLWLWGPDHITFRRPEISVASEAWNARKHNNLDKSQHNLDRSQTTHGK